MNNVIILEEAAEDIERARDFYDAQQRGIGAYFVESITGDLARLRELSGIHAQHFGFHRMLGSRFRIGIYYRERGRDTLVAAVLDLRRDPSWIRRQLYRRRTPKE
ncbi:MAG: type II toxin-antitoxin system RelE/ParE family toxin [Candidatus Udaeobacter sp.]